MLKHESSFLWYSFLLKKTVKKGYFEKWKFGFSLRSYGVVQDYSAKLHSVEPHSKEMDFVKPRSNSNLNSHNTLFWLKKWFKKVLQKWWFAFSLGSYWRALGSSVYDYSPQVLCSKFLPNVLSCSNKLKMQKRTIILLAII